MIFFYSYGRLGNQIFQYAFLKTLQKNDEWIITSGFEDLKEVFDEIDCKNLNEKNRLIRLISLKIIRPFLIYLSNLKIISTLEVETELILDKYNRESTDYLIKKGFFKNFIFIKSGYFQSEKFFDKKVTKEIKIKNEYIDYAEKFLKDLPSDRDKVIIHIRRGDYSTVYFVYGKTALLPLEYFKKQIEYMKTNLNNPLFIFLSDDTEFIKKEFLYLNNKIISENNHFGTDLAIITLCQNAILSPSTFGWWGSYLMENKNIIITPKYWTGFNSKIENHKDSNLSFAKQVEV